MIELTPESLFSTYLWWTGRVPPNEYAHRLPIRDAEKVEKVTCLDARVFSRR